MVAVITLHSCLITFKLCFVWKCQFKMDVTLKTKLDQFIFIGQVADMVEKCYYQTNGDKTYHCYGNSNFL